MKAFARAISATVSACYLLPAPYSTTARLPQQTLLVLRRFHTLYTFRPTSARHTCSCADDRKHKSAVLIAQSPSHTSHTLTPSPHTLSADDSSFSSHSLCSSSSSHPVGPPTSVS